MPSRGAEEVAPDPRVALLARGAPDVVPLDARETECQGPESDHLPRPLMDLLALANRLLSPVCRRATPSGTRCIARRQACTLLPGNVMNSRTKFLLALALAITACDENATADAGPELADSGATADAATPMDAAMADAGPDADVPTDAATNPDGAAADAGVPPWGPCGVYLLSSRNESGGGLRFTGDRDVPYVEGFIVRPGWSDLEPSAGEFDFSSIDDALARVHPRGQRLTVQILGAEPEHVIADASATWTWLDPNPRHSGPCTIEPGCQRPLPWDAGALSRQEELVSALAAHEVPLDGEMVPLAEHPGLDQVLLPLVGWGRIRELGFQVETDWPGYTREQLVDATRANIAMHYEHFPSIVHQVQLFAVRDDDEDPPLYTALTDAVIAGAPAAPTVMFLMENLAHASIDGTDIFGPQPDRGGAPLVDARAAGALTGMQMLTSWHRPFVSTNAVDDGNPVTASRFALETYGARYFEVYTVDVDAAESGDQPWRDDFVELATELCPDE